MGNTFTFEGRVNRLHYFISMCLVNAIAIASALVMKSYDHVLITTIILILNLIIAAKYICITVQRFHDLEKPGSSYWLLFIPLYNIYLNIILLFKRGSEDINIYGDNPNK